jgi:hypothetical protein
LAPIGAFGPRPRIPRELARRIDRLARSAHAFHRFAHHPLCSAYADEVYVVGRTFRVCRGCALGLIGALLGVTAGFALSPGAALVWGSLSAAIGLAWLSRSVRFSKYGSRLASSALAAFAAANGVAPAACAILIVLGWFARYRNTGPDRAPCKTCIERGQAICAGIAPLIRRERAFQRLSGRWLAESASGRVATRY